MSFATRGRLGRRELGLWALAFLLSRFAILVLEAPHLHRLDELYAGAAGREYAQGRGLPLAHMAFAPYSGGPILVALAAAPSMALLGDNMVALRALSLSFALATFLLWLTIAGRLFGRRTARFAGLLFVLPPPEYGKLSVLAWGNHVESSLPTAAAFACLAALFAPGGRFDPEAPARLTPVRRAALALAAGGMATMALFFSYASLPLSAAAALVVLLLGRRALTGGVGAALVTGAALGAVPALWLAVSRNFEGTGFLASLLHVHPGRTIWRALQLAVSTLPRAMAPHAGMPQPLERLAGAAVIAAVVALAVVAWRSRARPGVAAELFVLLPILFYALAQAASDFPITAESTGVLAYRYLAPALPFALVAVASALAILPPSVSWLAAAALVLPVVAHGLEAAPDARLAVLGERGSSYLAWGTHVMEVLDEDLPRTVAFLGRIPDERRRLAALTAAVTRDAAGHWLLATGAPSARIEAMLRRAATLGALRMLYVERLTVVLDAAGNFRLDPTELRDFMRLIGTRPPAEAWALARSAAGAVLRADLSANITSVLAAFPTGSARSGAAEGLGVIGASAAGLPSDLHLAWLAGRGFAAALAALAAPQPTTVPLPADAAERTAFLDGARRALHLSEPEDDVRLRLVAERIGLVAVLEENPPPPARSGR